MDYIAELQVRWGVIPASKWWAGEFGAEVRVTDFPSASTAMSIADLGPSADPALLLTDAVALSAAADRSGIPWSLVSFDLRLEDQDTAVGIGHVDHEEPLATSSSAGSEERDWRISAAYAVRPADLPQLDQRISSDFARVRVDREAAVVTSESHSGTAEVWPTLIDVDRDCRRVAESAGVPVRLLEWRITDDRIDERVLWS